MARRGALIPALLGLALSAGQGAAQELSTGAPLAEEGLPTSPVLTLSQDKLFAGSLFGKAVQARIEELTRALQAENRKIEADLEAEERALTTRRASLAPEDFRALAEAFDTKVEGIRSAQDAKARTVTETREAERQRFLETAVPILAELMAERGAVAILDKGAIILSFDLIDVTDAAIARIDAELGDGGDTGQSPAPANP
jgi:Skp family chaperone for outer membrane proteins